MINLHDRGLSETKRALEYHMNRLGWFDMIHGCLSDAANSVDKPRVKTELTGRLLASFRELANATTEAEIRYMFHAELRDDKDFPALSRPI